MKIENVMTRKIKILKENAKVYEAQDLMKEKDISFVPIVSSQIENLLIGIITAKDLINGQKTEKKEIEIFFNKEVKEIMQTAVQSVRENATEKEVYDFLKKNKRRRCPVVNSAGELVGIISINDLNKERMEKL